MIIHRLHQTEIRKFQLHKTTRLVHWSSQCLRILCFQQQRKQFGNNGEHIYGPGVDSASNRNEYQEYFLGGKGGRCVRLTTLPPSCAVVTKSGNLDFLEPSGPVQACNGTPLPFTLDKWRIINLFVEIWFGPWGQVRFIVSYSLYVTHKEKRYVCLSRVGFTHVSFLLFKYRRIYTSSEIRHRDRQ